MSVVAEQSVKDLRHVTRIRSFLRGEILHSGGSMKTECTVRDISDEGARIEVPTSFTLPENFELYIPARNQRLRAQTVWRHATEIGVRFKDATPHQQQYASSQGATDPNKRIQELEEELVKIRRQLVQMRSVLERFTGESI